MIRVTMATVPLLLLSACGGESDTPLQKDNTAQPNTPTTQQPSNDCGANFTAERSLNQFEFSSVFWHADSEVLQPKPEFRLYADKHSLGATHTLSSDETLCMLSAAVFGSTSAETWQGASNSSFKQGELFYYAPELIFNTPLPDFTSLADWRNKGQPSTVSQPIEAVKLTIHYRDRDNNLITFGDQNTTAAKLVCNNSTLDLTLQVQPVIATAVSKMDPAYCEEKQVGLESETHCLAVAIVQETGLENCQLDSTSAIIPDQTGNKSTVKIAGSLIFNSGTDAALKVNNIKI
ncbi:MULTISPECIES: hypothetical protein [Pseudoalteromonas]|uniref:Lipoprotein n=1 Tax=Pseudoalteromonas luteoviolacea (strain 2ta16) TaxID=1353533 RepID=V4HS38_PSEL2|nr:MULTISPECIES: hypothetical protein [Pseudoalteromonas]ESP93645.1 hypothetical protein PL2TA16_03031 [Pseudoalteromonas luteoviolacea 2ta16]KZN42434.1 hypothetical protein N483_13010 [Pseudoalteromonas luteoviolacea NCIMB 1944]MCG7547069.1 hypothetical protein [Pseudoalteromonas sp. Of7M-16]